MKKEKKKVDEPVQKETLTVPTKESVERNERLEELNQLRITTKTVLPPEKATISLDGVPFFELGDIVRTAARN